MSALTLRIIACLAMLMDHIGFTCNIFVLRGFGRIAFPIFVYLICNGYRHTASKEKYTLRLAVFAVISQIPFSLFCYNTPLHANGNVFLTLLIALMCIWSIDVLRRQKAGKWASPIPVAIACLLYLLGYLKSDYGAKGIVLAMTFYLFDGKARWKRAITILGCLVAVFYNQIISIIVQVLRGVDFKLPTLGQWDWMQLYSLCALPLIFFYNGKKGIAIQNKVAAKVVQFGFYLFYPVHMLVLWLIRIL